MEYYDVDNIEFETPRKRNPSKKKVEEIGMNPKMLIVLAVAAGYLAWCYSAKQKSGTWNWQPWKVAGIGYGQQMVPIGAPPGRPYTQTASGANSKNVTWHPVGQTVLLEESRRPNWEEPVSAIMP